MLLHRISLSRISRRFASSTRLKFHSLSLRLQCHCVCDETKTEVYFPFFRRPRPVCVFSRRLPDGTEGKASVIIKLSGRLGGKRDGTAAGKFKLPAARFARSRAVGVSKGRKSRKRDPSSTLRCLACEPRTSARK